MLLGSKHRSHQGASDGRGRRSRRPPAPLFATVADRAARDSAFIRRARTPTGAAFVQALAFGWLADPAASVSALARGAAARDAPLSRQGRDRRFTPAAADCLYRVLAAALLTRVAADAVAVPIPARFPGVSLWASTTVPPPDALAIHWPGRGGRTATRTRAALKVHPRREFTAGAFDRIALADGRTSDRATDGTGAGAGEENSRMVRS
jgi:hypothetical protein